MKKKILFGLASLAAALVIPLSMAPQASATGGWYDDGGFHANLPPELLPGELQGACSDAGGVESFTFSEGYNENGDPVTYFHIKCNDGSEELEVMQGHILQDMSEYTGSGGQSGGGGSSGSSDGSCNGAGGINDPTDGACIASGDGHYDDNGYCWNDGALECTY